MSRGAPEAPHPDPWWDSTFDAAVRVLAATGRPFETYDVSELGVHDPQHPSQWGAAIRIAAARGIIQHYGYSTARRPSRGGGLTRLWIGTPDFRRRPAK